MFAYICNDLCKKLTLFLQTIVLWLCRVVGVEVVGEGMRQIPTGATLLPKGWAMFDPAVAAQIGLHEAIVLQVVSGWVEHNRNHDKFDHFKKDEWWTWGDYKWWQSNHFTWWTYRTVGNIFRRLEADGLLKSDKLGRRGDQTKWYAPNFAEVGQEQLGLWPGNSKTLVTKKADPNNREAAKTNPPKAKRQSTPNARARRAMTAGVVAAFPTPADKAEMVESKPVKVELRDHSVDDADRPSLSSIEGTTDTSGVSRPSPSAASPLPFHPEIAAFWETIGIDEKLQQSVQKRGQDVTLAIIRYVKTQTCDSPPALARYLLESGYVPSAVSRPVYTTPQDQRNEAWEAYKLTPEYQQEQAQNAGAPPGWPPMFWPFPDELPTPDADTEEDVDQADVPTEPDEESEVREVMG